MPHPPGSMSPKLICFMYKLFSPITTFIVQIIVYPFLCQFLILFPERFWEYVKITKHLKHESDL